MTRSPPPALHGVDEAVRWLRAQVRAGLQSDSRLVAPGDGFIAWPGARSDGREHLGQAMERGAAAGLLERAGLDAFVLPDAQRLPIASLSGLKAAAGPIAAQWFGQPSARVALLAVTGTNGKSSSAWWLAAALNALSQEQRGQDQCALIGSLGLGLPPTLSDSAMTTPGPVELQRALHGFAAQGLRACAIEASSIGLAEERLAGAQIRLAIFSNFTRDHLDYHGSMAAYWRAKRSLFDWPGLSAAVVNVDDAAGAQLHAELQGRALDLWSCSAQGPARLTAEDITLGAQGLRFTVREGADRHPMQTRLIGQYNVSNLLGVLAALRSLGLALPDALRACAGLQAVPGRMQRLIAAGQPLVAVDYAHTPDALEKALQALRPLAAGRGGRLSCVFGCGGGRDAGKRALMGAVAQRLADRVLVTSDNPRGEDPARIVEQILQGARPGDKLRAEIDRAAAIAQAIAEADPADLVLIAGKGHEDYQEIAGQRRPFSDLAHAQDALRARGAEQWD